MLRFLIAVDSPNICALAARNILTELLPRPNEFAVEECRMPHMQYASVRDIAERAGAIVSLIKSRGANVCVGVASGLVPHRDRGGMPPERYDHVLLLSATGLKREKMINGISMVSRDPLNAPSTPISTLFGLKALIALHCKSERRARKLISP